MTYQIMTEKDILDNDRRRINWRGEVVGDYSPDYDKLIAESECEAEADAWRSCRKIMRGIDMGFAFRLVLCVKSLIDDKYHVLQFPYIDNYTKLEDCIAEARQYSSFSD